MICQININNPKININNLSKPKLKNMIDDTIVKKIQYNLEEFLIKSLKFYFLFYSFQKLYF
jgi:hypothetical protein